MFTIEHVDITFAYHIAEYANTCIPLDILPYCTLNISCKAEKVAFVLIERTRLIGINIHFFWIFVPLMQRLIINRLIAIEPVEVAHRIRLIGGIEGQTMLRNQVLTIIVHTEDTIVLGRIGCLCVKRVDILWVLRTVAIIIYIGKCTTLKTKVRIKRY